MTLETALNAAFTSFVGTKTAAQIEKFRKAFATKVGLTDEQDYTDVTTQMAADKIAAVIKAWVKSVDEEEATVTYTDMNADA